MPLPVLRLNPKADHRLRNGHLWVYSNEIDNKFHQLTSLRAGDLAAIESATGKYLGTAYINPNTLICGRIITKSEPAAGFDAAILEQRVHSALSLREMLYSNKCYRLIYGESDQLPGLVVDRFNDVLVVQIATAGMERYKELIVQVLDKVLNPKTILLKNDGKMREVEGLDSYIEWAKGEVTPTAMLEENGVKFSAPILGGQKTGWFYDHRSTRERLADYVKGKRVLDVFSYIGGWGIQAAAFGADEVVCIDSSEFALEGVQVNAKLNNLKGINTIEGDAFEEMQKLFDAGEKFDLIILDPPAFIPRRKDLHKGLAAYQKANFYAMRLLNQGGVLISGSCSLHLPSSELRAAITKAANKLALEVQILEQGHQSPDHPIHPAIPETEYLKSLIVRRSD